MISERCSICSSIITEDLHQERAGSGSSQQTDGIDERGVPFPGYHLSYDTEYKNVCGRSGRRAFNDRHPIIDQPDLILRDTQVQQDLLDIAATPQ